MQECTNIGENGLVDLSQMIEQEDLLKRYSWISTKTLGKWRREGLRFFVGNGEKRVYFIPDVNRKLTEEMVCQETESSNTGDSGSNGGKTGNDTPDTGTTNEDKEYAEGYLNRRFLKTPKTSSSKRSSSLTPQPANQKQPKSRPSSRTTSTTSTPQAEEQQN